MKTEYVIRLLWPLAGGPMYLTKKGWGSAKDAIVFPTRKDADPAMVSLEFLGSQITDYEVIPVRLPIRKNAAVRH